MTMSEKLITSIVFCVPLLVSALLLLYPPRSPVTERLRKVTLATVVVFLASAFFLKHTSLATMKRGDFWILSFFGHDLSLPHPYDYALIYQLPKILWETSSVAFVICSAGYWWIRRDSRPRSAP
jgi:hypothetical protein